MKKAEVPTAPDLNVEQVAEQLQMGREAVRVWLRAGRFPHAYRLSLRAGWRVPQADIDALKADAIKKAVAA